LLLVACANIANLLFVALASRRREMSMRTALGATRWRLGRQLLGEVAVLVVIGGTGGVFIGRALARVLVWWGGSTLPRLDDVGLTPGVVSVAAGLTAAATLVCGVLPAWLISDAPAFALVDDPRTTAGSTAQYRLRRGFVAVQIAAALMLLVAMLLTVRSFNRLQAVEPGFDGRNVLSAQLALAPARYARPEAIIAFADALHRQVVALPGVRSASAISLQPLSGLLSTQDYRVAGHPDPPPDEIPQAHYRIVMPGYFATMGIHVDGRDFSADDRETTRSVAIISKTFATRHWESESPIGEHLLLNGDTLEIVGVCADVKQFGLEAGSTADLYVPLKQMPANQAQFVAARMYLIVGTTGDPSAVADAVRGEVRRLDKDVAASSTRPMSAILSAAVGPRRFNTDLVAIAGATSVVLALVGVYAVTAFSIGRRTREIAIRLALGAQPTQAVRPVLAEEWTAIVGGLCVGASGAALLSRALSSTLFDAAGVEPLVIGAAAVMLGLAAIVATLVPARRIWRAEPHGAFRTDLVGLRN
jgi:putative ABC transport system permease protein